MSTTRKSKKPYSHSNSQNELSKNARGWVYVISNNAMPNLVKIGFSMKDPELRAFELGHTGSPHPYMVEYEALVENPYRIEQKAHGFLADKTEGKEWFRCDAEDAVSAIKQATENKIITETYKRAERIKSEALYSAKKIEADRAIALKKIEAELDALFCAQEKEINKDHDAQILATFSEISFFAHWTACAILIFIIIAILHPKASTGALFFIGIPLGALGAIFTAAAHENMRKNSSAYIDIEARRKNQLSAIRHKIIACANCAQKIRFDRSAIHVQITEKKQAYTYRCPSCKTLGSTDKSDIANI